ncbi:phage tail protein [Mycobacterium sp. TY813]|uniref:phage tail protein n=1 Tax=Mycobacterium TaxID=1763 RepID=UPI0027408D30|nr:phage tail protein [Mycobacterium sp. TY813]MDP7729487.1 phage tail protein [Mycobacterium sp. TY813]
MPLPIGTKKYMGSFDATIHAFGTISDLETPDMVDYTIEGFGSNAVLDTSVIQGDPGPPGSNAPLGKRMFPTLDSVDDLPLNLTDDPVDIGKYWVIRVYDEDGNEIGSNWAMWNGTDYELFKMGTPGQIGPVPKITPVFKLVTAEEAATWSSTDQGNGYRITPTGSFASPTWTIEVNRELLRGPAGVGTEWARYLIGDEQIGAVPVWNGTKFAPVVPSHAVPKMFTYPEGHFASVGLAIGTRITIGTALIPAHDWDVVPWVEGHFRLTGIEFDTTPFIIGVEVRLGSPTGQVVARGYGNITGYVTLIPHASTPQTPNDAITPDNGRAVIPAGATGNAATLFVNAYNDGAAGIYSFDASGAQLAVKTIPV